MADDMGDTDDIIAARTEYLSCYDYYNEDASKLEACIRLAKRKLIKSNGTCGARREYVWDSSDLYDFDNDDEVWVQLRSKACDAWNEEAA